MKRILALILAAMLLFTGCGAAGGDADKKGDNTNNTNNGNNGNNTNAKVTVQLGGPASVTMGEALTESQKSRLGPVVEVQEAPSCHYEGMDTVTTYDGFTIQTYRKDDADIVCLVEIRNRMLTTEKGIQIGSDLSAVKTAYGEPKEATEYYVVYDLTDDVTITFELYGQTVSSVLYELAA